MSPQLLELSASKLASISLSCHTNSCCLWSSRVVVQLGKALGLKVIGSVGSDRKVELLKNFGLDHVFNYKTSNYMSELKAHGPIDIYFDNVGGEALEAAIENANQRCRIAICGAISAYNDDLSKSHGVRVSSQCYDTFN